MLIFSYFNIHARLASGAVFLAAAGYYLTALFFEYFGSDVKSHHNLLNGGTGKPRGVKKRVRFSQPLVTGHQSVQMPPPSPALSHKSRPPSIIIPDQTFDAASDSVSVETDSTTHSPIEIEIETETNRSSPVDRIEVVDESD